MLFIWLFSDAWKTIVLQNYSYKAVNFLPNRHKIHPLARPLEWNMGVFCVFKFWLKLGLSHDSDVCNIVLYCAVL